MQDKTSSEEPTRGTPGLGNSGFTEIVMSVFDIERLARPFVDIGAFTLQRLPDAPPEQFKAWHVPQSCTRIEQAFLKPVEPGATRGGMRLVKFHDVEQRVMRSSQRGWDTGGIFDIDVFSLDVEKVYRRLQTYGWTALGEPVDYREAHFHVRQVVAVGPDGLMAAIIQRHSPPVEGHPGFDAMSRIFNSTQLVKSYDRSAAFYRDILGWPPALEFTIENAAEPGADVLGLPMPHAVGSVRKIGMFRPPGAPDGSVELIEVGGMHGRAFDEHCVAPNVGLLSLRVPVADAKKYAATLVERGAALYSPPSSYEIAPIGKVVAFSVRSPDGAILEFHSPT